MKTERTEAGEQGVIKDRALKRQVPSGAKKGGGDLRGTPLGDSVPSVQGDLFLVESKIDREGVG